MNSKRSNRIKTRFNFKTKIDGTGFKCTEQRTASKSSLKQVIFWADKRNEDLLTTWVEGRTVTDPHPKQETKTSKNSNSPERIVQGLHFLGRRRSVRFGMVGHGVWMPVPVQLQLDFDVTWFCHFWRHLARISLGHRGWTLKQWRRPRFRQEGDAVRLATRRRRVEPRGVVSYFSRGGLLARPIRKNHGNRINSTGVRWQ